MRTPDPIKAGPVIIVWLLALLFCFPQVVKGQATCIEQVADIQAYCKRIDRFIKGNPDSRRVFDRTSLKNADQAPNAWRETEGDHGRGDTRSNLKESAYVWLSQGKIVAVNFTFQGASRDWVQYAMYYYREDGTLARISAQLNVLNREMTFIREQFYDRKGVLLRGSTKSCALKTGRERKPERDYIPEPLPRYLTTDLLPFYQAERISNFAFRISHFPPGLTLLPAFHIISG